MKCTKCGKKTYIIYVDRHLGNICDVCKDKKRAEMPKNWKGEYEI